jgi:hypothetical protein
MSGYTIPISVIVVNILLGEKGNSALRVKEALPTSKEMNNAISVRVIHFINNGFGEH